MLDPAPAGQILDRRDRIVDTAVDRVRGAQSLGQGQAFVVNVDGDDAAGVGQARALDDIQAHAPGANDGDIIAWLDASGVQGSAHPGGDGAAQKGGLFQRHVTADGHGAARWHNGQCTEGAGVKHDIEWLATPEESRRCRVLDVFAQVAPAGSAAPANAAFCLPVDHDMIARADVCHPAANDLDDAGAFMPQDDGTGAGILHVTEIGVAHAAGDDAHQHLVRAGVTDLDGFQRGELA